MNYTKQYLSNLNSETGFNKNNIEKVLRLLDVLSFIFSKSKFKDKLVLKGGTAINLVYLNMRRLSLDIDLDYVNDIKKEEMREEKSIIESEIDSYMKKNDYKISNKSRGSYILFSRVYSYKNAFGNLDNIKIEINFINRIHVLPKVDYKINLFNKKMKISVPSFEELFAMKIVALIDRHKPRDLYDTYQIINLKKKFDKVLLKKCTIFYLSLDKIYEVDVSLYKGIESINKNSIKRELIPVLSIGDTFDSESASKCSINFIKNILKISKNESKYLSHLKNGKYNIKLLFQDKNFAHLSNHPMIKWHLANKSQ